MGKEFEKILKETPLDIRINVVNEMGFINLISELGYREDKMWTKSEHELLSKICKLAKEHTDNILREIKEWNEDDCLYAFIYNPMIEESVGSTISLHKTKVGAEKAMELHKEEERKVWKEHDIYQREEYGDEYEKLKSSEFGRWEDWYVRKIDVLP